jgi:biopolymer transport protein TolQ
MTVLAATLLQTRPTSPPAAAEPGLVEFVLRSGPMAKAVLFILVAFSLFSWGVMLWKLVQLRRADRHSAVFLDAFRRSKRFSEVTAVAARVHASPLLGLFQAGYAEIDSQIKSADPTAAADARRYRVRSVTSVERSLRRALSTELAELARANGFLATTAAATPFIGLFGTVWGIMVSFREIGLTGSTSLDTIAPGIAESLINTAAGLAAAIPALIGYNYFASRLRRLRARMEDFAQEFLNLTERNFT